MMILRECKIWGFPRDLFVYDVETWIQLKDQKVHCIFHDGLINNYD